MKMFWLQKLNLHCFYLSSIDLILIKSSEPLENRECYRIATTLVTNQPYTGYYEKEEFPISGIGDKQCESHCRNKYSCERADWIETDAWITIGNCFIYISEPTNTSLECSNCKMNGQFITKCKTIMLWN